MPPRAPGTLSNGVLSLKFMQRSLPTGQKPVEAEKAQLVDDSHWEIVHPPEKKALIAGRQGSQKGFDVTYEASYLPFLYGTEDGDATTAAAAASQPGPSGRRVFKSGQEVVGHEEPTPSDVQPKDQAEEKRVSRSARRLLSSSGGRYARLAQSERRPPSTDEDGDARRSESVSSDSENEKPNLPPRQVPVPNGKPQFLRPSGVDVPAAKKNPEPNQNSGKSKRDMLMEMIASSRASKSEKPATSSTAIQSQKKVSRKASDNPVDDRPHKKQKHTDDV